MQVRCIIVGTATLPVSLGALIKSYAAAEEKDETITLSQAPDAVQAAIQAQTGAGKIGKVVKGEDGGKPVFEAVITKGGNDMEISVSPDGKLLGSEETMSLKDVPVAVRKTIKAEAGTSKIKSIEKATEGDKVADEALITKDGKDVEIVVAPDGKLQSPVDTKPAVKEGKD